ncbi:NAD-dependent epimerase/dehydratase family protein [Streptomyces sp. VRA16 Mangrove soil]|uniref:NAD-dependent epimerase/dehydratase family protein n=1 Tax=Streptomyces sp. VRA16 Mangrove soil TaxID=2817434 RepID=UPI001A9EB81E|nr:NAD-dependent epimerase/dehydratase family protein [Streptomyces sp. VRA16 Mangrove soil]MBO1333637.1 NAD-dependent epimerase/dehydratase family protein [Streptomyces sp. VRA16 Mangrove soil]
MTTSAPLTYLVTGGAGFIGSHLTDALLAQGHTVVVLDDLSTGDRVNLAAAWPDPRLRFVRGSVLDARLVDELTARCDHVVHLAAAVGVRAVVEQPLKSFTTNARGTETVVEAARRHGRPLLFASTSEVYGKNGSGPVAETADRILGPTTVARWSYSTAKAVGEILVLGHHREFGLPVTVARIFNTVGPRQSPAHGMVVPRLAAQAVAGRPLTVYGDGTQRRCFTHVADTVDALLRLLAHPGACGEVFNVGSDEETAIGDLAGIVVERAGSPSPLRFIPYEEVYGGAAGGFQDLPRRIPDTGKLRELTGWAPKSGLVDIVDAALLDAGGGFPVPATPAVFPAAAPVRV